MSWGLWVATHSPSNSCVRTCRHSSKSRPAKISSSRSTQSPAFSLARLHVDEPGIGGHLGHAERPAEIGPIAVGRQHLQIDEAAVAGAVRHHRAGSRPRSDCRTRRAGPPSSRQAFTMSICTCHMPAASSDTSTTRGLARRGPPVQGGRDRTGDGETADHVAEGRPGAGGPLRAGLREDVLHAGAGPVGAGVVPAAVGVRPAGAERRATHVDEGWIVGADVLDVDAQACAGCRPAGSSRRHRCARAGDREAVDLRGA